MDGAPDMRVIIPFESAAAGEIVNDRYFGKVPADRLAVRESEGFLSFKCDGQYRSKIGLGPTRAKPALGSYSEESKLLTLVLYTKPAGAKGTYVQKVSLSSTMGPGVRVDLGSLAPS